MSVCRPNRTPLSPITIINITALFLRTWAPLPFLPHSPLLFPSKPIHVTLNHNYFIGGIMQPQWTGDTGYIIWPVAVSVSTVLCRAGGESLPFLKSQRLSPILLPRNDTHGFLRYQPMYSPLTITVCSLIHLVLRIFLPQPCDWILQHQCCMYLELNGDS